MPQTNVPATAVLLAFISILFSPGCTKDKAVDETWSISSLTGNIIFIEEWLDYTNSTITEHDFYIVIAAAEKFNDTIQEEDASKFTSAFLDTAQNLLTRLQALRSSAEYYVDSYYTTIDGGETAQLKKLYENTVELIQSLDVWSNQAHDFGVMLFEFSELTQKYSFQYP